MVEVLMEELFINLLNVNVFIKFVFYLLKYYALNNWNIISKSKRIIFLIIKSI